MPAAAGELLQSDLGTAEGLLHLGPENGGTGRIRYEDPSTGQVRHRWAKAGRAELYGAAARWSPDRGHLQSACVAQDAAGRKALFESSWAADKSLIDAASLALYDKDRLVAFCRFLPSHDPTDAVLAPIGILAPYRRQRLARALLATSMAKLKPLGYETISLYVSTGNLPAIAFYEKLGFVPEHKIVSLPGEVD